MVVRTVLLALTLAQTGVAAAQSYPAKPVRIIVPAAPGGGTDLVARVLAQHLNDALGQPVVVDNRGGGGTTLGATLAAKATPDGYTIILHHTSLAFNATFYRHLQYDALKDFAPITRVATQPFLFVAHPSLPVKSVRELVALARTHPGQIAYGSGGTGSGPYMGAELLKQSAHIDLLHVPYKGAGPAFSDLIGGEVQMMVATMSLALPHARTGRVRGLAVTSAKRAAAAPEYPTADESGLPGYEYTVWYGLLAPAGTPKAVIARLNHETARIVEAREVREKLSAQGLETTSDSPDAFASHIQREVEKWGRLITAAGIHAD